MKSILLTLASCFILTLACAADDAQLAAVTAADDARVAAMKSTDSAKLKELLDKDLRYAHSTGAVDTKEHFIDVLEKGITKYLAYDYEERNFTFPAPGIAIMSGRNRIKAMTSKGEVNSVLSYLAVWRLEGSQWRFLAWQSCKLP